MDFIPELPNSEGCDNILVIVDKLTKYAIFVPCTTSIGERETAQQFFLKCYCALRYPTPSYYRPGLKVAK